MERFRRALETRLSILPVLEALESSRPADHLSIREAPPFSLGRISLLLGALLIFSGFGLLLFYEPTAEGAAESLAILHAERPIGWLLHNTHRWSALLLLVAVILHALRGWLAHAYWHPRDLNWWLGILSLLLVIGMGATGYLLRWDIKAFALMDLVVHNFANLPVLGPILLG
ncbi:MAG: cytochrome b N-terminal domain-containing protein, partial [Nitrospiraceae bacterium]